MSRYADRVARLRTLLAEQQLDALIVTSLTHLQYLLGFTGTNGIGVFGRRTTAFLTDSRYRVQSARQVRDARRYITQRPLLEALAEHRCLKRLTRVGFESHHLTFQQYRVLRRTFPRTTFVPTTGLVEQLLLVKDPAELSALRAAMRITDEVFAELLGILKAGMREKDVAAEITYRHRVHGADGDAFDPIVASGERGSLPHARAGDRDPPAGELVTLDFGCTVEGYHSDLTRTVALGRPTPRAKEIYRVVREAQAAALRRSAGGMPASDLDAVARTVITDAGYGAAFSHSLGHGLGLHIHERPRVSALSKDIAAARQRDHHRARESTSPAGGVSASRTIFFSPQRGARSSRQLPKTFWFSEMTPDFPRRRVLVIAYYFPPMGLSGVQRTLKFVKYLPQFNWQPTVLTVQPRGYLATDESLLEDLEGRDVLIERTGAAGPGKLLSRKAVVVFRRSGSAN